MSTPLDPRWDDHGEWDALAVGWALSALEAHDEARFAVHLPTCARCTATVRETLRTVSDLAYAVPDEAPPAGLKQRIMAAAAAEPRDPIAPPAPSTPVDEPVRPRRVVEQPSADGHSPFAQPAPAAEPPRRRHAAPDEDDRDDQVVPLEPRRRGRRWAATVASAAAVVLIAALGAWNFQLRSDRDALQTVVAQREAAISQLTADGPAKVSAVQEVDKNLKPLDTRAATIVVKDGRTTIIVEALSPRTGAQTYWLWTLNCNVTDLKPITAFQVDTRGFSIQNVGSEPGLATTQCFALSAETKPGTPTAPERVVAVGQLK